MRYIKFILQRGFFLFYCLSTVVVLNSCKNATEKNTDTKEEVKSNTYAPSVDASSLYTLVEKQVGFGPRVPGSQAHQECGDWIVEQMTAAGLEIVEQEFPAATHTGKPFTGRNIIASLNPSASKRVLLAAHWDTRAMADKDDERKMDPIPGANDGGSGVAVLMEIASQIAEDSVKPNIGIDFVFFDAEDGGAPADFTGNPLNDYGGYCLGSEYWSKNPHKSGYTAFYGILLDMVGAKGAQFTHEDASMTVAPSIVKKVWDTANSLGYGTWFLNRKGGSVTDDHWPVIQNLKIPMIDIIDMQGGDQTLFFDAHHTHDDDMSKIDPLTLKAVAQTVIQVLYNE